MKPSSRPGAVTLKQLRAFSAVAQARSFTGAAQRLHLSQSAVSLLVRELEAQLEVRLFERGRQPSLTAAGEEFLRSAVKVLEDMDLALDNLRVTQAARRRLVRIAVGHLLASTVLPRVVAGLARERPDIDVQIVDCAVEQVAPRVLAGEVDAGIGSIDAGLRYPELSVDLLFRDSIHLASSRALPPLRAQAGSGALAWRRLAGEPMIMANPATRVWERVHDRIGPAGTRLQAKYEVAMYSTALAMARAGLGRLLVPCFCAREPAMKDLVVQPLGRPVIRWDVSVLRRQGAEPSEALQDLLARVREAVA